MEQLTEFGKANWTSALRFTSVMLLASFAFFGVLRPLARRATSLAAVPALHKATFKAALSGLRPGSPDDLPFIGRSEVVKGLIYACGHYRNGALRNSAANQL